MAIVFSPLSEDTHDNNEQAKSHESRLIKSIILLCLSMRKMERVSKFPMNLIQINRMNEIVVSNIRYLKIEFANGVA